MACLVHIAVKLYHLTICKLLGLLFLPCLKLLQVGHILADQPHPFHSIIVELPLVKAVIGDLTNSEGHLFEGGRVALEVFEGE